eukprot:m.16623 g.16623  ORF g.16623 m.16623 type:complete len:299 (-) comp7148_c0_seq1:204-1100(-)
MLVSRTAAALATGRMPAALSGTTLAPVLGTQTGRWLSYQARKKKALKQMKKQQPPPTMKQRQRMQKEMQQHVHTELDSLGMIVDPWVPVPPAYKESIFSLQGIKARFQHLRKRIVSIISASQIKRSDKGWNPVVFAQTIQDAYIDVNTRLSKLSLGAGTTEDDEQLKSNLTVQAYHALKQHFKQRPHTWEFMGQVERPTVVHINAFPINGKTNMYAQVAVRVNLTQKLKFGNKPAGEQQDVEEYLIVERHLANPQSTWRISAKLTPLFKMAPEEREKVLAAYAEREQKAKEYKKKMQS